LARQGRSFWSDLANAPELLSLGIALWVGIFLYLSLIDAHRAATYSCGRLHRGALAFPVGIDATIDFRHRGSPRAGNHARNHLCERGRELVLPRSVASAISHSGRLADRCTSTRMDVLTGVAAIRT